MSGDGPSFEEFAAVELPRLLGFAIALTGDRHDAWDLAQEALARIGARWRKVDINNPSAYARTTIVRLNLDRLRVLRRERPTIALPQVLVEDVHPWPAEAWLLEALKSLTPRQRTAVALRFVLDLDLASIAREMDCSIGTAKSHLSCGVQRLRAHSKPDATKQAPVEGR
jgi:RNA polymerase sigma factor (sigma-70 family)